MLIVSSVSIETPGAAGAANPRYRVTMQTALTRAHSKVTR
jgi:hypothetical protein